MSTTVEKISSNKVKLSFDIDAAKFDEAMGKAYIKVRGQVAIPGFRKGHAPRKMIENMYGEGVFYDEAFELIFDEVYGPAIDENKLEVVDRPQVDIQQIGTGKNLQFTCEVFVKPDVTLGEYKGVEVKKEHTLVSDEDVNAEIEKERNKQAAEVSVDDRAVAEGDTVNLDYSGSVDGVKFAGGTAEGQTLKIGSHTFIPGFEEQMVGMTVGEEKDLNVTFPEKYHAADLAGKDAVFACKIKAVQQKELPEIDDEFIKDISEFDTVAQWKENKKAELLKQRTEAAKISEENELLTKAADNAQCDIPECMIERQVQGMIQDMAYRLAGSGISMDNYFKYMGTDMDKVKEMYKPEARMRCKVDLTLEAIKKAENITAAPEEVEEQIDLYATQNGMTKEDLEKNLSESDREYFADRACVEKVIRLLSDSAVRVDAPAEEKKDEEEQKEEKAE